MSDLTVRGSWLAAFRRYENYDYVNNVATTQFPGLGTSCTTGAGGCSTRMVSGCATSS